MSVKLIGTTSGVEVDSDSNKNLNVYPGLPAHPVAGGWYTVTGGPAGIVAAALATDTSLAAMRFSASSTRKAYLTKFRIDISCATIGASAGVGGVIGLQRFTTATPSGGTSRTVNKNAEALATTSDMTSVQDLASALTMTSVVFGNEITWFRQPLAVVDNSYFEFIYDPDHPLVLVPGDGIVMRTRVQLAATQTWVFSYTAHWYEK